MSLDLIQQTIGHYRILEQLGAGGMATVYRALDTRLDREVAVKFIRREEIGSAYLEQMLRRFEREAKSLARLSHPNIVKVYDYGEHGGVPYLVMEYLPGGTLKQRLGRPLPPVEAARLLIPIARALAYAHHQGIIHRDMKPANILITQSGDPMLTDFGIAKILQAEMGLTALTASGAGLGTPDYMAPEQWTNDVVPQTDIYALGVVFYEMVTGRRPYSAETPAAVFKKQIQDPLPRPRSFVPGLPDQVEQVLCKALERDPKERYATMDTFAEALESLTRLDRPGPSTLRPQPTLSGPLPPRPSASAPTRRDTPIPKSAKTGTPSRAIPAWLWASVAVVAVVVFTTIGGVGVWALGNLRREAATPTAVTAAIDLPSTPMPVPTEAPGPSPTAASPAATMAPTLAPATKPTLPPTAAPTLASTAAPTAAPMASPAPLDYAMNEILFTSDVAWDQTHDLYVMAPDGFNVHRLTNGPGSSVNGRFSPDGSQIVFASDRTGEWYIYRMQADGSQVQPLAPAGAADYAAPDWSPDGRSIVYACRPQGLCIMNADGSNNMPLTGTPDRYPRWSHHGDKILFMSDRDGNTELYVVNRDGTGTTNLTDTADLGEWAPNWSPDDTQILFSRTSAAYHDHLCIMNADGSGLRILTGDEHNAYGVWSPDGTEIVFNSNRTGALRNIFVMNADGSNPKRLTSRDDWANDWK